ncbi:putative extracellular polygalacturonase [Leptodontidium sp. MPI-SDFR-AT-0119]|nr:putative extracellular polygalacturonase [Leptodontidium sp. MPI-SDFR-AT-0119]
MVWGVSASTQVIGAAAPAPTKPAKLDKRASGTCTFSGSNGAALASKSKTTCATIVLSALAVPSGITLDLTGLNTGTHVVFQGTTTFGYEEWTGPLISISGTSITVVQTSGAVLNGGGAQWWDGQGDNGKVKPKFFSAHNMVSSNINGLQILNPPHQVFSIDSVNGLTLSGITIDGRAGDTQGGKNTDGFDIGDSSGVIITGATLYNQDDCIAVNSGTVCYCSGGHGLSIGVRVKTVSGATGSVNAVTYMSIAFSGITDYGITGNNDPRTTTSGVPITKLILNGVTGTVNSGATNIYVDCGSTSSCSGWTWSGVSITGGKTSSSCPNIPTSGGAKC